MSKEIELITNISNQITKMQGSFASKADVNVLNDELASIKESIARIENEFGDGETESVKTRLRELEQGMNYAKDNGSGRSNSQPLVDHNELKAFIKTTFDGQRKTSAMASFKINSRAIFANKAAEIMGSPAFYNGTSGNAVQRLAFDPKLYSPTRKRNLVLDFLPIESVNAGKIFYAEKEYVSGESGSVEDTGGAEWVTSGGQKPMKSFRTTTSEAEAKKVAIFSTIDDKLLRDVPSLDLWIREELTEDIKEAYNDALLNNNPGVDPDAPQGIKHAAVAFSGAPSFSGQITDPTEIDAIVAAAAGMAITGEQPAMVFVSYDTWYKIHVLKDGEARYQNAGLVYSALGGLIIGGVQVLPVDGLDVPSSHLLLIGADLGFKIKNYGSLIFERGLNGEDFRHDRTSYRAYQEVLSYIPSHRENSVMYDSFANIFADITLGS